MSDRVGVTKEGFPSVGDPGRFFSAPPTDVAARPHLAASGGPGAGIPDAFLRAGSSPDIELVSPPGSTEPDDDGVLYVDTDDQSGDYAELEQEPQRPPQGAQQPGDAQEPQPEQSGQDVTQDPRFQELAHRHQYLVQQTQNAKAQEIAGRIRGSLQAIKDRRRRIYDDAKEGRIDMDGLLNALQHDWIQSDQELGSWMKVSTDAASHVHKITHMADVVQRHGLTEAEAERLVDVQPNQMDAAAEWLVTERQRAAQSPEIEDLKAQVAALTEQVNSRNGRRRSLPAAAHVVGGGTSAPAQPRRIRRGSDEHLANLLFNPRGGFSRD